MFFFFIQDELRWQQIYKKNMPFSMEDYVLSD